MVNLPDTQKELFGSDQHQSGSTDSPRVLNKHRHGVPKGAVYIGRPSPWGNPFAIGKDGTRAEVIDKYRRWLKGQPKLIDAARRELAGKYLVCFCWPAPCHGDVLLGLANSIGDPNPIEVKAG